ncbi:hypothetical protein [Vulcanisaeta thermophila]|uniref:hypothetical protein n=1 Tax=Vulcanisaeta thermophila TaxID=867917 RepID=UPI0008539144|nr:hypothetical protein [Vulcanisaeta thermophila]
MFPAYIVGVMGLVFIVVGWAMSIGDVPPLKLTLPYLVGSALLTVYSVLDWNIIFIILNGLATALSGVNMVRGITKSRTRDSEPKRPCST